MNKVSPLRHLMANVLWSDNGWTAVDLTAAGKEQFAWTAEHPDDHADATLFDWEWLSEGEGYVPFNMNPRLYTDDHNGTGLLFIASLNQSERRYYLVGFFSDCDLDTDYGWFSSDLSRSVRFAVPIPLQVERHCPELKDGRPRTKTFGQNNFNYIRDQWAVRILEDALEAQPDELEDCPGCTLNGEPPREIIRRVLHERFGSARD